MYAESCVVNISICFIIIIVVNVLQYRHTNISKNKHVCSNSDAYLKAGGKHCQQLEVRNVLYSRNVAMNHN